MWQRLQAIAIDVDAAGAQLGGDRRDPAVALGQEREAGLEVVLAVDSPGRGRR